MDAPSSTPFPLSTFQSSASTDSPAALRDFLQQTIADSQPSLPYKIKHPNLETWIPILSGLSGYVLSSFPPISTGTWDILHEKAVLVYATVDVFHLFTQKFSNLFDTSPLQVIARNALVRLMILCHVLDCRNDGNVYVKDGIPSPKQLREKCLTAAKDVMRYLGDSLGFGGVENPTWEVFRSVYGGCLGVGEGERYRIPFLLLFIVSAVLLGDATLEFKFPLELSPFQQPHVKEVTSIPDKVCEIRSNSATCRDDLVRAQPNIENLPSFFVRDPVEAVNLLCIFFDIFTQSTSPPVSSQSLHTDLVLRLTKLMQSVFDSCLSGTWPIPLESLAGYLIQICFAGKRLLEAKNACMQRIIFADMVSRLMLHRLCNRCTLAEDAMIRNLLNECPDIQEHPESGSCLAILSSIGQLRSEDESGFVSRVQRSQNIPRVLIPAPKGLAMTYLSRRIPSFNMGTSNVIKSVLSSSSFSDTARNELGMIDRRLAELASGATDVPGTPSTRKVERLRALLLSIFPEPAEAGQIESLLTHGTGFSGETVCRFIREKCSR